MTRPTHTHVCPACGKEYKHAGESFGSHWGNAICPRGPWFLACSKKCAQHLDALERYLRTRGL